MAADFSTLRFTANVVGPGVQEATSLRIAVSFTVLEGFEQLALNTQLPVLWGIRARMPTCPTPFGTATSTCCTLRFSSFKGRDCCTVSALILRLHAMPTHTGCYIPRKS